MIEMFDEWSRLQTIRDRLTKGDKERERESIRGFPRTIVLAQLSFA